MNVSLPDGVEFSGSIANTIARVLIGKAAVDDPSRAGPAE